MDSLPITLIVKAPNQQIEDQKIRCETSWTINKLKQHLSEVYPSKPPQHEQKLIYSGQLLTDSLVLKDILRQYDDQDIHTLHLVCTPEPTSFISKARSSNPMPESSSSTANSSSATATQPTVAPAPNEAANRVPTYDAQNSFPWTNYYGQMNPATLNQYQMQMAWMQQAYLQYMSQYMQSVSGQPPVVPQSQPIPPPAAADPLNPAQPNQPNDNAGVAPAVPNPAQPQLVENEERDWLDVFYMLSRTFILFTIVYFYSSPVRFIFVLFLGFVLYLYQSGFFRNININNNNIINGTPEGVPQEEQAPTRLTVAWTFITTFFASLIPDIPNINA